MCCAIPAAAPAQTLGRHARPRITERIDESNLRTLRGNTHPLANAANDRGAVPDDFAMEHMLLQLKRTPEQNQAVEQFLDRLHDAHSADFHRWLTPAQFGEQFGVAQQDLDTVTTWLRSRGFVVNTIYPGGMAIDFSGTAAQVRDAFHTGIHRLEAAGQSHIANMSDPEIPAALAPVVAGVVSMHDFKPHEMRRKGRAKFTFQSGGQTVQAITPGDMATIYNLNPLFAAGATGKGQTIAVIEDTQLYSADDWNTFRSTFSLTQYTSGSLATVYPGNCRAPGVNSDDSEAILDAEWASAAAPDATIEVATCRSTFATFGGMLALENLINAPNPPSIVSISYGQCEAENGESGNAAFNTAYQQAVAEGISIFVAAGDEGAASCDSGADAATHGIGVSGWASTPYNVAVGGTDFDDAYAGTSSSYWNASNSASFASVLSYVPEIPWNDSCAGRLLAGYLNFSGTYGANSLCNSLIAKLDQLLEVTAGSGGPSGCATGTPLTEGVAGGSCQGYVKPSWQSGVPGIPNDGVRDLPDVSIFAGTGVWGHYYVTCFSDQSNGGAPCTGDPSTWAGAGGTSFGAPVMAGIQAIVNQQTGGAQGNPNYVYYRLAADPASVCESSNGDSAVSPCVFHDITQGDIDVNCGGTQNCYGSTGARSRLMESRNSQRGRGEISDTDGALSILGFSFVPAYGTAAGWNFATGIGSINAYNLVKSWASGQ